MTRNESNGQQNKQSFLSHNDLRLGELLQKRRKELKLSLDEIERDTHIRSKYLKLIEAGDYSALPNDVYSRGYVKNYSEHLGFDTKEILRLYSQERYQHAESSDNTKLPARTLKPIDSPTYTITPRTILVALTSLFVLIMVGYVGWQLSQLSAPPVINLTNSEKSTVNGSFVIISGEVDGGSDVFINDSPILTTPDGSFSERVTLVEGSNQIKITAKNKFGKEATKTIIVESKVNSAPAVAAKLKTEKFDGVEVLIAVDNQAAFITIEADGQSVFKGTMLPGSKQLFTAKDRIKVTTSNAGSTQIRFTNSIVVDYDLGVVGRQGEAKQDIIFTKDTELK